MTIQTEVFFSRTAKKKEESHSDYHGSINIEGKEYWLNAWLKTAGEKAKEPGQKFFSLSVKEKNATHEKGIAETKKAVNGDYFKDDIPF